MALSFMIMMKPRLPKSVREGDDHLLGIKTSSQPKKLRVRKPIIGYKQPLIEIVGHPEQGKSGIAMTAAALNPDMKDEPGCPKNFEKLFENTNNDPNGLYMARIIPIDRVTIADVEIDSDRLATMFSLNEKFPKKMFDRLEIVSTLDENDQFDLDYAISQVESLNQAEDYFKNNECIIYDSLSKFINLLNHRQKSVSKKHAELVVKRRKDTGNSKSPPAILDDDALAKFDQKDWEWRNDHLNDLITNAKASPALTIFTSQMKQLWTNNTWDGKTWTVDTPRTVFYAADVRISLERSGRTVEAEILKNRWGMVSGERTREFELGPWILAEILLWIYGIGESVPKKISKQVKAVSIK